MHSRWRRFPWKGWFPVLRNFYWRTCVKFTLANEIEAKHLRSLVSVKVEPRTWLKFTWVNLRSQKRVSGNQPEDRSYASLPTDVLWGSFVTHSFHFQYPMNSHHYYSRYQKYFLHFGSLFPFLKWMRDKRTPKDVCGEARDTQVTISWMFTKWWIYQDFIKSPARFLFSLSPAMTERDLYGGEKASNCRVVILLLFQILCISDRYRALLQVLSSTDAAHTTSNSNCMDWTEEEARSTQTYSCSGSLPSTG